MCVSNPDLVSLATEDMTGHASQRPLVGPSILDFANDYGRERGRCLDADATEEGPGGAASSGERGRREMCNSKWQERSEACVDRHNIRTTRYKPKQCAFSGQVRVRHKLDSKFDHKIKQKIGPVLES